MTEAKKRKISVDQNNGVLPKRHNGVKLDRTDVIPVRNV